jgi:type I restriction enzyme S subunit
MEFELKRLGELCTKITDGSHYSPKEFKGGVPMYSVKDMTEFGFSDQSVKRISEEDYEHLIKADCSPRVHDVLIAKDGSVLKHVFAIEEEVKGAVLSSIAILRPRPDYLDSNYLVYALKNPELRNTVLTNYVSGSGVPRIILKDFKNISISIPSLANQRRIARVLKTLDNKIYVNIQLSRILESIAQTIFKSWFVDFDPVRAKMAGEEPVGMDAETAALFPDSMEESELGMIPSGWTVSNIRGICDKIINGSTPLRSNKNFWDTPDLKWFKTGELADGFLLDSKEHISSLALERTSVKVLPKGAVLMAIYAAPTVGRLGILTSDATFNQACTGMLAQKKYGLEFLYLNLLFLRKFFNSRAIGAAQQNISKVVVEEAPVLLGSDQLHLAFSKLISPIFAQIESLTQQNRTLAEIRDALLPRLISGELQIPDEMLES